MPSLAQGTSTDNMLLLPNDAPFSASQSVALLVSIPLQSNPLNGSPDNGSMGFVHQLNSVDGRTYQSILPKHSVWQLELIIELG